jgi:hypothetical protein
MICRCLCRGRFVSVSKTSSMSSTGDSGSLIVKSALERAVDRHVVDLQTYHIVSIPSEASDDSPAKDEDGGGGVEFRPLIDFLRVLTFSVDEILIEKISLVSSPKTKQFRRVCGSDDSN